MATHATPEFRQGAAGYARYFWHAAVDQTSENYMVEFVVPAITHEDARYYTLGSGGFLRRTSYALSRAVITRSETQATKSSMQARLSGPEQLPAFPVSTIPRVNVASRIQARSGDWI